MGVPDQPKRWIRLTLIAERYLSTRVRGKMEGRRAESAPRDCHPYAPYLQDHVTRKFRARRNGRGRTYRMLYSRSWRGRRWPCGPCRRVPNPRRRWRAAIDFSAGGGSKVVMWDMRSWTPIQSGSSPSEEAWTGQRTQLEGFDFGWVISHVVGVKVKMKRR
jgi:hypothetical protein